jgi:hypothetical protein
VLAALPAQEQPLPVPPPGEVDAPDLPAAAIAPDQPEVATTASAAPQPGRKAASAPALPELPDIILLPEQAPDQPGQVAPPQPGFPGAPPAGFGAVAGAGFSNAPGIDVNRLPSIGSDAPGAAPDAVPAGAALRQNALAFAASGAPLLAVVLLDPGPAAGGVERAALAALGLPLTVALDPMRADVTEAARAYRAAGLEIAILAAPLPAGATAMDLEVALAAWRRAVPGAVALVEPPRPLFQGDRLLSQQLVAALARDGLGLVTQQDIGLNAARQLAGSAALPQAGIWRVLDTAQDRSPAILRYLDRAGFEASRGDGAAVMLHAWPESLAALAQWAARPDSGVQLAPISALALAGVDSGG